MTGTYIGIGVLVVLYIIGWWLSDKRSAGREKERAIKQAAEDAEVFGRYEQKVDYLSTQINGKLTNHITRLEKQMTDLERRIARIEFALGLKPEGD